MLNKDEAPVLVNGLITIKNKDDFLYTKAYE